MITVQIEILVLNFNVVTPKIMFIIKNENSLI